MRRTRTCPLPVVAALTAVLLAGGCNGSGSGSGSGAAPSASPGLLDGTVTLAAPQPLSAADQQAVRSVLKARLAALHIDAVLTITGGRVVRLRVPAPTVDVVRELGAAGRLAVRPVETVGPKGQPPPPAPGALPPPIASSAGHCAVTAPGDTQGWTVACDAQQKESYLLWPAELTNADVASATEMADVSRQPAGQWSVNISWTAAGQRRFHQATQRSLGMQVAFVVDGVVESAPVIGKPVDGDAQITAMMDEAQARLLAALIGNGALPVALRAS